MNYFYFAVNQKYSVCNVVGCLHDQDALSLQKNKVKCWLQLQPFHKDNKYYMITICGKLGIRNFVEGCWSSLLFLCLGYLSVNQMTWVFAQYILYLKNHSRSKLLYTLGHSPISLHFFRYFASPAPLKK